MTEIEFTTEHQPYGLRKAIPTIKDAVPIEQVATEYGEFKLLGNGRLLGRCVVQDHTDRTPSMTIFTDTQRFKCFGCGTAGDVIDFEEVAGRHLETWTAVVALSTRYGVEFPTLGAVAFMAGRKGTSPQDNPRGADTFLPAPILPGLRRLPRRYRRPSGTRRRGPAVFRGPPHRRAVCRREQDEPVRGRSADFKEAYASFEPVAKIEDLCAADVNPEAVEWLWARRIPYAKLTIFDGDPDKGKSMITVDIGARVSTGRTSRTDHRVTPATS
jgi:hypothetical protein